MSHGRNETEQEEKHIFSITNQIELKAYTYEIVCF